MSVDAARIPRSELVRLLESIATPKVLVVGDLILDRYTWGDVPRVSPEAPVLILKADRREVRLGGAASVCGLLAGLGAVVGVAGLIGDDHAGQELAAELAEVGVSGEGVVIDESRSTTIKDRFIGRAANRHPHQILRVDTEQTAPMQSDVESKLIDAIDRVIGDYDAILISDYAKGACSQELCRRVIEQGSKHNVPILVDPARRSSYDRYRGATLVTPNRAETELAWGSPVDSIEAAVEAGTALREQYELDFAAITLDREGMVLVGGGQPQQFPTRPRRVYDITGAGDMVLAMLGLCLGSSVGIAESIELANTAAGLEVEQVGVVAIPRDEIASELRSQLGATSNKIVNAAQAGQVAESARRRGQKVVFTNGCFDLLHVGHVQYLQEAATMGDMLMIGLNSDHSVGRLKGPSRPVIQEGNRAAMLAALECVDHVIVF